VPVNPAKALKKPVLISYLVLLSAIVLVACLHLGTPFVAVMFAYFLLTKLSFFRKKWIAIICFMVLMAFIFYGFVFFLRSAWVALPEIINTAIPRIVEYADKHDIDLPFTDVDSLKDLALQSVRETLGYLGNFAKIATKEFALLIMAVVIGIAMFINPKLDQEADQPPSKTNLYSFYCALISERFAGFYRSFERVMGAQLIISLINTCLTAMFVYSTSLYYKTLMPHAHLMRNAHLVVILTFMWISSDRRESHKQCGDRGNRVYDFARLCDGGVYIPGRDPQAGILPQQQDHRLTHPPSNVAPLAGLDPGRAVDGHPRYDPGTRDPEFHQDRGHSDSGARKVSEESGQPGAFIHFLVGICPTGKVIFAR